MKKTIVTICGVIIVASVVAGAVVTNTAKWNVPFGDAWRSVVETTLGVYETQINLNTVAVAALQPAIVVQIDTNATTSVTLRTPVYKGQVLVGKTGATNQVWIAAGTTTNDWVPVIAL